MTFKVALETVVATDKVGGDKHCSVAHTVLEFDTQSDADHFIICYDRYENPQSWLHIYRTVTRLY